MRPNAKCSLVDLPSNHFDNVAMRINSPLPKTLGKKIQKLRKEARLTQEELAERVNVSRAYMGFIEQGRNTPSLEVLEKISKILKIPLSNLF